MRTVWTAVLLCAGLILGASAPAWAVVSGDVQIEGGEALALDGATVRFVDESTNEVVATSTLDANGRSRVAFRDEDRDRDVVVVFYPRGAGDGTRLGAMAIPRDDFGAIIADLDLRQVAVTGRPATMPPPTDTGGRQRLFDGPPTIVLDVFGGFSWSEVNVTQTNTVGAPTPPVFKAGDDANMPMFGADVRVYPRNIIPGLFVFGAGVYNVNNTFDVILGDAHGGDGIADLGASGSNMWSGLGGLGLTLSTEGLGPCAYTRGGCFDLSVYGGGGFAFGEINVILDESAAGGGSTHISDEFSTLTYAAGASISFPICPSCSWPIRGEIGGMAQWMEDVTLNAHSSPFGFDYGTRFDFEPIYSVYGGLKIPFAAQ